MPTRMYLEKDGLEAGTPQGASELKGVVGWQQIETAPKDIDILLYCPVIGVMRGRWSDEKFARNPRPFCTHDRAHLSGIRLARMDQPTHWMPLPDAPTP